MTAERWAEEATEPEDWSMGLPTRLVHRWLWRGDGALARTLGDEPVLIKPGSPPEIEDMVDAMLKMRRHSRVRDEIGVRLEAQAVARFASTTVAALNKPEPVDTPRAAVDAATTLPIAPEAWSRDLLVALGLLASSADEVAQSAERLAVGTLRLVREVDPGIDEQPDVERYFRNGTFERMIA